MKFGKYLIEHSVPEWKRKYIDYKQLKESIKRCVRFAEATPTTVEFPDDDAQRLLHGEHDTGNDWTSLLSGALSEDLNFVRKFREEVMKVCAFLEERCADAKDRYQALLNQCRILEGETLIQNQHTEAEVELQVVAKTKDPRKQLRDAIQEYYRMLQLLENYRILNEMAARKILKKFHKARNLDVKPLQSKTKTSMEVGSEIPKQYLKLSEDLYLGLFDNEDKKRSARKALRINDDGPSIKPLVIWRAGFMTGLAIPALIAIVYNISVRENPTEDYFLLQVYGGFSIPIFFFYLFSWCLIILQQAHVNWILIFELDPRSFMSPIEFEHFASGLLLFFSVNIFLAVNSSILGFSPQIYVMTVLIVFLSILFCPFKAFYYEGRMWVLETLWRIMTSGFHPVQFRDFFLSDLLSSMTYSFVAIQSAFCITFSYPNGEKYCVLYNSWLPSLVTSLPAWFRLVQCFRRYYDNRHAHPHLTNSIKYILSITAIIFSIASKFNDSKALTALWILFSGCASIYAYLWDVLFDWGLFAKNSEHKYLRNEITYPPWFYYFSIGYEKTHLG
jgi:hypothetical protein